MSAIRAPSMKRPSPARHSSPEPDRSQVLFGELAKLIRDRAGEPERRPVFDRLPSETIADLVDRAIGDPARHPSFAARAALFILEPERELHLQIPASFELRHRNAQQRNDPLLG